MTTFNPTKHNIHRNTRYFLQRNALMCQKKCHCIKSVSFASEKPSVCKTNTFSTNFSHPSPGCFTHPAMTQGATWTHQEHVELGAVSKNVCTEFSGEKFSIYTERLGNLHTFQASHYSLIFIIKKSSSLASMAQRWSVNL